MKREKRIINHIKSIREILCGLIILFSFISCQPAENNAGDIPPGMGKVTLRLADNVGRTILPATPVLSYFYEFELTFFDTAAGTALTTQTVNFGVSPALESVIVPAGSYIITVDAYTASNQLAARGVTVTTASPVSIAPAITNNVSVTLRMLLGEAGTTGTFSWNITLPAPPALNITTASMIINTLQGNQVVASENLMTTATGIRTPLPSNMYNVVINLVHTETIDSTPVERSVVVWHEILHIYSTLESNFTYTFTAGHFNTKNYKVTFDQDYPDKPQDALKSVLHNGIIGTLPAPSRSGYSLEGWYSGQGGTGTKYDGTEPILSDIILYANWVEDTTVVINLDVDPIEDADVTLVDGADAALPAVITISRSGTSSSTPPDTFKVVLQNASVFDSFEWAVAKVGSQAGTDFTSNSTSFVLDANETSYNSLGGHLLRLTVEIDGIQYQINIPFTIVE